MGKHHHAFNYFILKIIHFHLKCFRMPALIVILRYFVIFVETNEFIIFLLICTLIHLRTECLCKKPIHIFLYDYTINISLDWMVYLFISM